MKLGQLQWALFWLSVFVGGGCWFVWILSLLFTDFDKFDKEEK